MENKVNTKQLEKLMSKYLCFVELDPLKRIIKESEASLNQGWLTEADFINICRSKSTRPTKHYESNTKDEIKKITKEAFAFEDDYKKVEKLITLKGVSIPVASAILAVFNPKKYGMIDVRALKILTEFNIIDFERATIENYIKYLDIIRMLAVNMKQLNYNKLVTPRNIDHILYRIDKFQIYNL